MCCADTGESCFEKKVEADSEFAADYPHDEMPTMGVLCFLYMFVHSFIHAYLHIFGTGFDSAVTFLSITISTVTLHYSHNCRHTVM